MRLFLVVSLRLQVHSARKSLVQPDGSTFAQSFSGSAGVQGVAYSAQGRSDAPQRIASGNFAEGLPNGQLNLFAREMAS